MDDKVIIKYIKKRKAKGLELFVDKYGGFIKAIIRQNLYNFNNYEDECMDDILLSIWNNIERFDESKNTFKNWVASVTRYRVIDYNRKYIKNREYSSSLENGSIDQKYLKDNLSVEDNILREELREEIESLLENLKPRDKELFIKYYLEEKNVEKLSKDIGLKSDVIYNRLSRGRMKLRKIFNGTNI